MKVILTSNIKKLGKVGDTVNVKDGFEGAIGPNHQRSTINGWKYCKLPWKQQ